MVDPQSPATLSCYTASLAGYLARMRPGYTDDELAGTVRLAVDLRRDDGMVAFSHHNSPLDRLGDGTRLTFHGTCRFEQVRAMLQDELDRDGCALVVGYSTQMPWSAASGGTPTPHFLLVEGHHAGRWCVTDRFTGLLANGQRQESFSGPVTDDDLRRIMRRPEHPPAKHDLRTSLAFGFETPLPDTLDHLLLVRRPGPATTGVLPDHWVTGTTRALEHLGHHLAETDALCRDPEVVDDCWAAAQHHRFRLGHLPPAPAEDAPRLRAAVEAATEAWAALPRTLRFAARSAARGRGRPSLVRRAFDELAAAENALSEVTGETTGETTGKDSMSPTVTALAELLRARTGSATGDITGGTHLEHDLRMNSAQIVELLTDVEAHFDCTIEDDDLGTISRVGDLAGIVDRGSPA